MFTGKRIPSASITTEDSAQFARMFKRKQNLKLKLKMNPEILPSCSSSNVVIDIKGSEKPDEMVLVGAHIDSWDLAPSAQDDAGAVFFAYEAIRAIVQLNLRAKRTIRFIAFTGEEINMCGIKGYIKQHETEIKDKKIVLAFESDYGAYMPYAVGVKANTQAQAVVNQLVQTLMKPTLQVVDKVEFTDDTGPDISQFMALDTTMVQATPLTRHERYFYYHHAPSDFINVYEPRELDHNAALLSILAYTVADMNSTLPRA